MKQSIIPYGPAAAHALPVADTTHIKSKLLNLPYRDHSPFQCLDLYYPDTGKPPFPLILAIHGGAWMMCDKADVQLVPMLQALQRGYAVASLNYRLSWEAKFPAQIQDIKAAIRFLRGRAQTLNLDPQRFAAWGGSAGAHLSALAGLTGALESIAPEGRSLAPELDTALAFLADPDQEYSDISSAIKAVVAWYGPTNFLMMDEYLASNDLGPRDHGDSDSPESRLLGSTIALVPELVRLANPETYVSPFAPPFFLQHGKADSIVPYQHSVSLAGKLRALCGSGQVHLELLEEARHADPAFETPENVGKVLDFFDSVLS
jgi:acetyl esterase/lipase